MIDSEDWAADRALGLSRSCPGVAQPAWECHPHRKDVERRGDGGRASALAERLLDHRGPKFVIPLGFSSSVWGFMLLVLVISSEYASWVILLPDCALAASGWVSPIRPHQHATTAVPPERSGLPRAWL